jgi:WD40 repeat protein
MTFGARVASDDNSPGIKSSLVTELIMVRSARLLPVLSIVIALSACQRDLVTATPGLLASAENGIEITIAPASAALEPDQTMQFTATVRAKSGEVIENAPVEWSSSNGAVATVTHSGLVTAVAAGQAQVQAMFSNVIASAPVTVEEPPTLRGVILYVTSRFGPPDLAVVNPDGSGRRLLTTDGRGYGPEISPDGRKIVFARFGGFIYVMNADASDQRQIFSGRFPSSPVWSPDGSRIAFGDNVPGPFGDAGRIFVMNADGTGVRQLSPDVPDPNQFYYFDAGPSWSPDGSKIAFSRFGELMVINVDGTGMVMLSTPDGAESPSWSPDGTRLAFSSWKATGDIFVSNADGSNPVRVTSAPEQENNPRWSPDSRRLVFCRVVDGIFQLYLINADGTDETRLSADPNAWECPAAWSPVR